jgi:hypothetical protein
MAIAPFDRIFIPRLRQVQRQRTYARYLINQWETQLPGRLLPNLVSIALPVMPDGPGAALPTLNAALAQSPRIRLAGGLGSGRSLAVQQMIMAWANGNATLPGLYPVVLHVPTAEAAPDVMLQAALRAAGIEQTPLVLERGLAAGQWLLVVDDWDQADPARQRIWRQWLLDLATRYPVLPALITTADDGMDWPEFTTWRMAPATPDLLQNWLRVLLPNEETSLVAGPLMTDDRVRTVGERVSDVAILALTYTLHGYPSNRAHLYATALDKVLRPIVGAHGPGGPRLCLADPAKSAAGSGGAAPADRPAWRADRD